MNREMKKTSRLAAGLGVGLVLVLLTPIAASATTTVQLGGKSCSAATAETVHISSTSQGTIKHWHHRTGSGSSTSATFVNSSFIFRMSGMNYKSETASWIELADGTIMTSKAIFCDN